MEIVVTRLNEPVDIFVNRSQDSFHFLTLDLRGKAANRDAIGTQVKLNPASGRTLENHVSTAVGYGGSSDRLLHFGLGADRKIPLIEIT